MDFNCAMKAFADKYSLAIEPKDGAVVLDFNSIPVSFMDAGDANLCGGVKYCEQFKFDLTGETLKMTCHQTSQQLEA